MLKVPNKELRHSEYVTLIGAPRDTVNTWLVNNAVPLIGAKWGAPPRVGADGRLWRVYLQPDALLAAVANEMTRDNGLSWPLASFAVHHGWDAIYDAANEAEGASPPVWVAVADDCSTVKVGTFDKLAKLLQGDGAWRVGMVNLTEVIARVRARAAQAGIELSPFWKPEITEEARQKAHEEWTAAVAERNRAKAEAERKAAPGRKRAES